VNESDKPRTDIVNHNVVTFYKSRSHCLKYY